jgi:hypothetical protein
MMAEEEEMRVERKRVAEVDVKRILIVVCFDQGCVFGFVGDDWKLGSEDGLDECACWV